jgi:biotin carboxylase
MSYICLLGGSKKGSIEAAKSCGYEVYTIADKRIKSTESLLAYSSMILPADFTNNSDIVESVDKMVDYKGKPKAIISFGGFGDAGLIEAAQISSKYDLPSNSIDTVLRTCDKGLMRKSFSDHEDLDIFYFTGLADEIISKVVEATAKSHYIVKPVDGVGSKNITLINTQEAAREWFQKLNENERSWIWILEEYIVGYEYSVEVVSCQGNHIFLGITEKLTENFVEMGHVFPATLPKNVKDEIERVVGKALDILGVTMGATHTEVKVTPENKVKIIETHTRPGGDCITELIEESYGFKVYQLAIESIIGIDLQLNKSKSKASAIRFFSSPEGYLEEIRYEEFQEIETILRWDINIPLGKKIKKIDSSFSRFGYVICTGETAEEAKSNAEKSVSAIFLKTKNYTKLKINSHCI